MQPSQPPDPSASPPPTQVTSQPPTQPTDQPQTQTPSQPPAQSIAQPPTQVASQAREKPPPQSTHRWLKGLRERLKILWKWGQEIGAWQALFGLLLGLAVPALITFIGGPPSESIIRTLMNQEAQAAMNKDRNLVAQIYSPQAVVMDAGCTSAQGQTWPGLTEIQVRYSNLPSFDSLAHIPDQITWVPNNSSATTAYASANTFGALGSPPDPIHGHEQWVFAKINGQWLITLFTYNLCTP